MKRIIFTIARRKSSEEPNSLLVPKNGEGAPEAKTNQTLSL
jgi:hypothetical protein